jgi:hypothetical protein
MTINTCVVCGARGGITVLPTRVPWVEKDGTVCMDLEMLCIESWHWAKLWFVRQPEAADALVRGRKTP